MEKIREVATMCVARAVMFGTLAIFCIMISFAFNPAAAFRTGAILALAMAGILILKAHHVLRQHPKRTEVWLYLDENARPRDVEATARFASVLREVYGRFAQASFAAACVMFTVSLLLGAAGLGA